MADLEGAFDSVWRLGALYKLHKAGISENLLLIFTSFMRNCQQRNLVNTHVDVWSRSETGAPQGSILSPLIFLVYTADITADLDFNFWRLHNNYYTLLVIAQLAIIFRHGAPSGRFPWTYPKQTTWFSMTKKVTSATRYTSNYWRKTTH